MSEGFTVTDGSVEYKHSKPLAEYESKAPMVRLNFTLAEGANPDTATRSVMSMVMTIVEDTIAGKRKEAVVPADPTPAPKKQKKSAPAEPTTEAASVPVDAQPADAPTISEATIAEEGLTLKGDVQPLAQRVSAHLRKEYGNINKLRDVIKECGGENLLTIPEANWPQFIEAAKKLLP